MIGTGSKFGGPKVTQTPSFANPVPLSPKTLNPLAGSGKGQEVLDADTFETMKTETWGRRDDEGGLIGRWLQSVILWL